MSLVTHHTASPSHAQPDSAFARILDRARFAPSGDNEQPWHVTQLSPTQATIHIRNRYHSVNDPDGIATGIATGIFLETIALAAAAEGYAAAFLPQPREGQDRLTFRCDIVADAVSPSPLAAVIETRQTHRGWMSPRRLSASEKQTLEDAVSPLIHIRWFEGRARRTLIKALRHAERLRLETPEILDEYRRVVDWDYMRSEDRMPVRALGINPLSRLMFRQILRSPLLRHLLLRYGGLAQSSYLELAVLPSLFSGALVAFTVATPATGDDDYLAIGRALQRFWLTATTLGLLHQPNFLPVAVSYCARAQQPFSRDATAQATATRLVESLAHALGGTESRDRLVWMGRIGAGKPGPARSIRFPLARVLT